MVSNSLPNPSPQDDGQEKNDPSSSGQKYTAKNRLGEFFSSRPIVDGTDPLSDLFLVTRKEVRLFPSSELLKANHRWCKDEVGRKGKVRQLSTDAVSDELASIVDSYQDELFAIQSELPEDSPLRLARPPLVIRALELTIPRQPTIQVALVEIVNTQGEFLIYDGNCLETTSGGPSFIQLSTTDEPDIPMAPVVFYSPGAFSERVHALTHDFLPEVRSTYLDGTFPYLLTQLALETEVELSAQAGDALIPDPSQFEYQGTMDDQPESPHVFETDLGTISVKFSLDKSGMPNMKVKRLG